MSANIEQILNNIKEIYLTDSNLTTLLDVERVLDELDLYTFSNWKIGELIAGPIFEKYFVTTKWMYPYRNMPDPAGAERLLSYGCEVFYQEDTLEYPIKVVSPDDFKAGTQYPRMVKKPIWEVTIVMPKKLMGDIQRGSVELENDSLQADDIETSYEEGLEDETTQDKSQTQDQTNAAPTI